HPFYTPTACQVNEWKPVGYKIVAHVDHIGFWKENHAIAVGMSIGIMQNADILAVQMYCNIVVEGENGKSFLCHGLQFHLDGAEIAEGAAAFQALANIVMGNDRSICLKDRISSCVIEMVVRVDNKAHGFVSNALQRRFDLVRQWGELIIHDNDAILTD